MAKAEGRIARRYAKALLDSCQVSALDAMQQALSSVAALWSESADLRTTILNPAFSEQSRLSILRDLAEKTNPGDKYLSNLLSIIFENRRISLLPAIAESFAGLVDEMRKILSIDITSAFPIEQAERGEIEAKLKGQYGSLARIEWTVDRKIIGGLLIRSGDKLLDSSVQGALMRAGTALAN